MEKKRTRSGLQRIGIAFSRSTGSLCLLAALLASGCSGEDDKHTLSRAGLLNELQRNPGIPFALPRTLPSGYKITSAEAVVKDLQKGDRVTVRQVYFNSDSRNDAGSLVDICIEELAKPDQCGTPSGEDSFTRQLGNVHIVVNLHAVTSQDARTWKDTVFTTNLSEVTWLQ
ncbi:hypothetical protein [Streptosporangium roseum]|uniref:hypothetical protein n=1 Tax=Streptosporangium roseum TaxID=2001 RepID=UPI003325FEF1